MGAAAIVILVLAILGVNALIWVVLLIWLRGRLRRRDAELRALLHPDERFLVDPAVGNYRGATARFGKVTGTGVVALTDRRALCAKAVGSLVEVPLAEVVGVRDHKWFLRSYSGGRPHVILKLRDDVEVGFQVRDHARWMELLRAQVAKRP